MLVPSSEHESRVKEAAAVLQKCRGQHVQSVPTPAAVVDRRIVNAHCNAMLAACKQLGVSFRAHIKTHKTVEATKLQVGDSKVIRLVVSTIPEIAIVLPWLLEEAKNGRSCSILYSMPLHPTAVEQLNTIAKSLPQPSHIAVMIDHPDQLKLLDRFSHPPQVFLKLDTGLHRAGVPPGSEAFSKLVSATLEAAQRSKCALQGLYSHASQSYAVTEPEQAMSILSDELRGCQVASAVVQKQLEANSSGHHPLVLSVGATPTATAARNLVANVAASNSSSATTLREILAALQADANHTVELHAGVYPFLDLQQISTQAAPSAPRSVQESSKNAQDPALNCTDVAFTVLTEVASLYPHRNPPQALVTAGSLALGREPCPRYTGFGAVQDRNASLEHGWGGPGRSGWAVGKISQEHGLLFPEEATGWEGTPPSEQIVLPFEVGQRLNIIPNHACIAGAGFPYYYVVDGGEEVVDVWVRCHGWQCA